MKAESVLSNKWETFGEIQKATGIDRAELSRLIEHFFGTGKIKLGLIGGSGCQVPVMRLADGLKPVWKRRKVKQ